MFLFFSSVCFVSWELLLGSLTFLKLLLSILLVPFLFVKINPYHLETVQYRRFRDIIKSENPTVPSGPLRESDVNMLSRNPS